MDTADTNKCAICFTSETNLNPKVYCGQVFSDAVRAMVAGVVLVFVGAALTVTIVLSNERMRVDDPVLADNLLAAVPRVKAAGVACEVLLFSYQTVWSVFGLLQTRRLVLTRRFMAILAICYLLRLVCIGSNILPRSYQSMQCAPKAASWLDIVRRASAVFNGAGMTILGGHMCGNYFFSGHALTSSVIYHSLAHYMPGSWVVCHVANGLVATAIPVTIILSHNHYTIDLIGSLLVGTIVFRTYTFLAEHEEVDGGKWIPVFWLPLLEFLERDKEVVVYRFSSPLHLVAQAHHALLSLAARRRTQVAEGK